MNEESLFAAVLEKPTPQERLLFLQATCENDPSLRGRLEKLLTAHDRQAGILEDCESPAFLEAWKLQNDGEKLSWREGPGSQVGPYTLLELIGEGGFGLVFRAEQQVPLRRQVALKLIKPGMDTCHVIARFAAERQALAMMNHPNIARVLDAGATDAGHPYFVMELVDGVPITIFADRHQLSIQQRLELFMTVCQAVQHAHQKGIIHRDLKPSNILVSLIDHAPVVKVIDFGIAKALHEPLAEQSLSSRCLQLMGTPSYMSPEQSELGAPDIDTRSDVYSLGVVLYELLTGSTPFNAESLHARGLEECRRILREEDPVCPSTRINMQGQTASLIASRRCCDPRQLRRLIRGELDWIILKSLEKDRAQRYATAADMAGDLQRYLRHESVEAGPNSPFYRIRKWLRRHRGLVAATLLLLVALVAGVIGTSLGMVSARRAQEEESLRAQEEHRQRQRAEHAEAEAHSNALEAQQRADVALELVRFLRRDLLEQASPQSQVLGRSNPNPGLTIREALDRAALRLGDRFHDQPSVEAAIRSTMGATYHQLGLHDKAIAQLQRAVELLAVAKASPRDMLDTQHTLAMAYRDAGRSREAILLFSQVLDAQKLLLGERDPYTLVTWDNLAVAYRNSGQRAKALEFFEKVRNAREATLGPEDPATLVTLHNIASLYLDNGQFDEAIVQFEKVLEAKKRVLGEKHLETLPTLANLAVAYWRTNQLDKSVPLFEEVVARHQKMYGPEHPDTIRQMANLGVNYRDAGRLEDAIALLRKVHAASRLHRSLSWATRELQIALMRAGRKPDVMSLIQEKLTAARAKGTDSSEYSSALLQAGAGLMELKAFEEAESLVRESLAIRERKEPDAWRTFNARSLLGEILLHQKKYQEAEPLLLTSYGDLKGAQATIDSGNRLRIDQALDRIIAYYTATNQLAEVKKWQSEKGVPGIIPSK